MRLHLRCHPMWPKQEGGGEKTHKRSHQGTLPPPRAQGALMRPLVRFLAATFLLWPHWVAAQVQPHRAEYALWLGGAVNAPRIGTAVQDLSLDCGGWHLRRDITTEI